MEDKKSFADYLQKRIVADAIPFFEKPVIQKAYFTGAYARAVIATSYFSEVSKKNTTYKSWLSNQIISYRNLDRIFEMAFRYEQKLKLTIYNDSEVRNLAHNVPTVKSTGVSSAKISYAFVAGLDDYRLFMRDRKLQDASETSDQTDNP